MLNVGELVRVVSREISSPLGLVTAVYDHTVPAAYDVLIAGKTYQFYEDELCIL